MAARGSFIRLGLMQLEAIKDPVVREELEQLVAAIQTWAAKIIPIDNIPVSDIRIDASQIVSGILLRQRGGTGIDTSGGTNGQLIIARTGLTPVLANLLSGPGISIVNGSGTITISLDSTSSASIHSHGMTRLTGDGATVTFNLVDYAEQIEMVSNNGSIVDPYTLTLSADGGQLTFSAAPAAGNVLVITYVIARV